MSPINLADVMDEIAEALDSIEGLRTYAYPPDSVQTPAAVVRWPESIEFDAAMQRGLDRMTGGVTVAVSRAWDRAARDALGPYCDGAGSYSVKAALKAHAWTSCSFVRAELATFETVNVAGVDYVAAQFVLDIAGPGTT